VSRLYCVVLQILLMSAVCGAEGFSELWGQNGEKWSSQSRLPDFSHAGYHSGEKQIPLVPVVANVKDYGAAGDGITDDSQAFMDAIAAVDAGAILIPAGRYVLMNRVRITKSNIVLRGEGPDKTIFYIPKSLLELSPKDPYVAQGVPKLHYSFGSAFIEIQGRVQSDAIGQVAQPAKRGDRVLVCAQASQFKSNDYVRLKMNTNETLGRHLHAGQEIGKDTTRRKNYVDWVARVEKVSGDKITLDRPLRLDVRLEWEPVLSTYGTTVQEVGLEGLAFEFAGTEKKKHLLEEGFNAIQIGGVMNCWVKDVRMIDADMGIKMAGRTRFSQIENVEFSEAKRTGRTGHHAIWFAGFAQDNLVTDFRVKTRYVHDLSVEGFANGNVFRKGSGVMMNFDHHRNAPYENLFTDIDVGDARRLWSSGGRGDRGPNSAVRTTVWNIRHQGEKLQGVPKKWPQMNVVGVAGYDDEKNENGIWVEPLPDGVVPRDLYEAQVEQRKK